MWVKLGDDNRLINLDLVRWAKWVPSRKIKRGGVEHKTRDLLLLYFVGAESGTRYFDSEARAIWDHLENEAIEIHDDSDLED